MKKIWKKYKSWMPPVIGIFVLLLSLYFLYTLKERDYFGIVLGITLGVLSGYIVDFIKEENKRNRRESEFKRNILLLLEEDAKHIYSTFELYSKAIASPPKEFESGLFPIPISDLFYWQHFKQKDEFLMLANEPKFRKIFKQFWSMERLKDLVHDSKTADVTQNQKYNLAVVVSKDYLNERKHEELLLNFLSQDEIKDWWEDFQNKKEA